jgi:metal transporter CNNM
MLLDWWLGMERMSFFREQDMHSLLGWSAEAGSDIGLLEAMGARNFFDLDDVPVAQEGEPVHAQSIIALPSQNGTFVLPKVEWSSEDPFLRPVNASGEKWVIVTDLNGEPAFVLDADHFLRDALFDRLEGDPARHWHRHIVVRDMQTRLGEVIGHMKVKPERPGDDVSMTTLFSFGASKGGLLPAQTY